jgi:hypothetical protein
MRGVQPFLPQQLAHLARLRAGIRPAQNLQLVLGREAPPRMPSGHLGVRWPARWGRGWGLALEYGRPSAPALPYSPVLLPYRGLLPRGLISPPCSLVNRGVRCLSHVGTEGAPSSGLRSASRGACAAARRRRAAFRGSPAAVSLSQFISVNLPVKQSSELLPERRLHQPSVLVPFRKHGWRFPSSRPQPGERVHHTEG